MNGARRLFKMLEDFAGNIASGFGDQWSGDQGQAVYNLTTTMATTTRSTTTSAATTIRSTLPPTSMALDVSYKELLDKYYSTSTTEKPKTMLERVKEQGAFSTWNMNKQDKWKLLAQLSKSYLEKRLGRRAARASTVFDNVLNGLDIQWETVLDDIARSDNVLSKNDSSSPSSVSDQSNIIPTFGMQETLVRSSYYDKFLPLKSKTQIRKKRDGGGFSIFSLLNFMLVVLNIVIDINNNINNNK